LKCSDLVCNLCIWCTEQRLSLLLEHSDCAIAAVYRELTTFTSCMECDPSDNRFPTDETYRPSYIRGADLLTPQRLHSLCSISNQRTFSSSTPNRVYVHHVLQAKIHCACSVSRDVRYRVRNNNIESPRQICLFALYNILTFMAGFWNASYL